MSGHSGQSSSTPFVHSTHVTTPRTPKHASCLIKPHTKCLSSTGNTDSKSNEHGYKTTTPTVVKDNTGEDNQLYLAQNYSYL